MSNNSLMDEAMGATAIQPEMAEGDFRENVQEETKRGLSIDFSFLKTPTGDGEIGEYLNHPLNFNKSEGVAQVLRGVTGFTGDLKLAIIDIVFGIFKIKQGGKGEK